MAEELEIVSAQTLEDLRRRVGPRRHTGAAVEVFPRLRLKAGRSGPPVPGDVPHAMDGIEGDGSLRSFIEASILARELARIGAVWPDDVWSEHSLLENGPDPRMPVPAGERHRGVELLEGRSLPDWDWHFPPPADWRPAARRQGLAIEVTLHTITPLVPMRIVRHRDIYDASSLRAAQREPEVIAEGNGGETYP